MLNKKQQKNPNALNHVQTAFGFFLLNILFW